MAYEHMNDDNMALRYFQKAINKNPSQADYKVKKVSVLLRLDRLEEAKATVEEILLNDPELYDGYHMKTAILLEEKDFEGAAKFAKTAFERFPEDVDLLYDYAKAVGLSGDFEEALHIIENAKKMQYFEESKAKITLLEAEINAELGNMDKAIAVCDECIAMEKEDELFSEARFMRINLALTIPDFESALSNANAIIEKENSNSYYFAALYFKPYCLKKLGKEEDAQKYYKEAISFYRMATLQNPSAIDAYLYRIMCLRDVEKYDEALELLEFMENLSEDIAEIYTIRADIYKMTGKDALVKEELEKAYKLKPELRATLGKGGE